MEMSYFGLICFAKFKVRNIKENYITHKNILSTAMLPSPTVKLVLPHV